MNNDKIAEILASFVESSHKDYGHGYFCTPDVMAQIEALTQD
jgi:hypothetical protein